MEGNNELNSNIEPASNYEQKNNNVLLIVLIVLAIAILAVLSYKIFVLDKKDKEKENNNVVEKEDVISKTLDGKIKENIINFPYVSILRYNMSYDELYKTFVAYKALDSLEIEVAPGLPDATIKGDTVRSAAKQLYNYELNYDKDTDIPFNKLTFNGESNIYAKYNKANDEYSVGKQGITGTVLNVKTILNTKYNNGVYTATFIDGIYNYTGSTDSDCNVVDKSGNKLSMKCFSTDSEPVGSGETLENMAKDYAINHKDELPQYEITFKIDGDNYSFDNIKKIN